MVGKQAEEQKHKVDRGFYPNKKNFATQNSCGFENWDCEHIVVTPLTTALHEAETRMNRGFAGGGGSNLKA